MTNSSESLIDQKSRTDLIVVPLLECKKLYMGKINMVKPAVKEVKHAIRPLKNCNATGIDAICQCRLTCRHVFESFFLI